MVCQHRQPGLPPFHSLSDLRELAEAGDGVPLPRCLTGVPLHLGQGLVAADGHDLVRRATGLRQAAGGGLAKTMSCPFAPQTGLVAPFAELVAEASGG